MDQYIVCTHITSIMNRRRALQSITVIAAGAALLPSCTDSLILNLDPQTPLQFSANQSTWVKSISEAILPKGDRTLTTFEDFPAFVGKMIDFTSSQEDKSTFVNGYNLCISDLRNIYESDLDEVTPDQIITYFEEQLNTAIPEDENIDAVALQNQKSKKLFCEKLRGLSIQHLRSSKEYQEEVLEFQLVPEKYQACVNIKSS